MQANVVVDASGNPRITDFGHTRIAQDIIPPESADYRQGFTARWAAPEVFLDDPHVTKESDIFSFGMVIIEVKSDRYVYVAY